MKLSDVELFEAARQLQLMCVGAQRRYSFRFQLTPLKSM